MIPGSLLGVIYLLKTKHTVMSKEQILLIQVKH